MANLITLTTYKDLEGITNTKDDARIDILITSVSQLVKTYCANSLVDYFVTPKVEEITVDYTTNMIQLTESPVVNVASVEVRTSPADAYVTLNATDYYVNTTTDSIFKVDGSWQKGLGSIRVTYTAGYETCPADLVLAVVDLVTYYLKDEYKERKALAGASIQQAGTTSQRNNVAFPDHIKRVLDLYKVL